MQEDEVNLMRLLLVGLWYNKKYILLVRSKKLEVDEVALLVQGPVVDLMPSAGKLSGVRITKSSGETWADPKINKGSFLCFR